MSTQARPHERSISIEGTFTVIDHDGRQVEVRRELVILENADAEWSILVTEPDPAQPEGDVLASALLAIPSEASPVFDAIFAMIAVPATGGPLTE